MIRIGFAYNQKPDAGTPAASATRAQSGEAPDAPFADEEPPSTRRDATSRFLDGGAPTAGGPGGSAAPSTTPSAADDDEYAEWDTAETIDAVARALAGLGEVVRLEADADFPLRLRDARPGIVFNIAEGLRGVNREAHVPAICEFYGAPYSGSDPFTLALCLDKAKTKEFLSVHGIPTAPFALVRTPADLERLVARAGRPGARLQYPLFAKPLHEGSSKGITQRSFCRSPADLAATGTFLLESYAQPVIVEEFLPGREFTCAVMGNGETARVLPVVAMNFAALPDGAVPVYSYEAKWIWDTPDRPLEIFECPARVDRRLRLEIERVVLGAYRVLGCRDWARIDVRLDAAGVPNIVEVNPLPGILPNPEDNSCFPKAARAAGLSYEELIQSCLLFAAQRQGVRLEAPATLAAFTTGRRARREVA